ncbi:MAG: glycosyltransferase family 4 protein [Terracidiphilus sp.]
MSILNLAGESEAALSPVLSSASLASMVQVRSLAYLVSQYPTLSMIFVLREVVRLRALGFRIATASINPPDRPASRLTAEESAEVAHTYCVKSHGLGGALAAHLGCFFGRPGGYLRGLGLALRLGGPDPRRLFYHLMYFTEALMLGRWMRRERLAHLHCHLAQQAATVGLYVKRVFGFGLSITVHGPDEFFNAEGQHLARKVEAADFLVCISSFARSQLMYLSPYAHWARMSVVRLGVDPTQFSPALRRPSGDFFEVLCVGRLTPAKGQHLLIEAVEKLAAAGRRVRLRLVGTGPDASSLRRHADHGPIPERIIFEGAVNQDRIRSFYSTANAFALPSFAEGIPVVLMEAMAMGIPCVSTRVAGIPELIRDGVDGLLVAASDVDELAAALARLMDDGELRERLAASARERVLDKYNLERNVARLARLFAERVPL